MAYSDMHYYTPHPGPFARYLRSGEAVLWRGAPYAPAYQNSRLAASALAAASIVLALLSLGLHLTYAAFGLGAVALAATALAIRRSRVAHRAAMVEYALTEEKLLILVAGRTTQVVTYGLQATPVLELEEKRSRWHIDVPLGSIRFQSTHRPRRWSWLGPPDPVAEAYTPAFVTLQAPRDVYRIIEDARDLPRLRGSAGDDVAYPAESREEPPHT